MGTPELKIKRPPEQAGVGWKVYEHLQEAGAENDPHVLSELSPAQAKVLALGILRSEVNSGGLDSYLRYHCTSQETAEQAINAAETIGGPQLRDLVSDAIALVGKPFPSDEDQLLARLDSIEEADEDAFNRLDTRYYELEEELSLDEATDRYVWDNAGDCFLDT